MNELMEGWEELEMHYVMRRPQRRKQMKAGRESKRLPLRRVHCKTVYTAWRSHDRSSVYCKCIVKRWGERAGSHVALGAMSNDHVIGLVPVFASLHRCQSSNKMS